MTRSLGDIEMDYNIDDNEDYYMGLDGVNENDINEIFERNYSTRLEEPRARDIEDE